MIWVIIIFSLIGLCVILGVLNIVITKIKKKKHSEKGEEK